MDMSFPFYSSCSFIFTLNVLFHFISIVTFTLLTIWMFKRNTNNIWGGKVLFGTPPGSNGFPFIGETLAFIAANNSNKGFYDFVSRRHLRYGNCFKTKIFGNTHVFISSAEVAKSLLGLESPDFSKRYIKSIAELLGKQSLLCSSHEIHSFLRRHISGLVTLDSMTSFVEYFDDFTIKIMREWESKQEILVHEYALKITFNAICKMIMSLEREDELERLRMDVQALNEAMLAFPLKFPNTRFHKGIQARKRIMNALREKIEIRRKGLENFKDFLQFLVFLRDDSGKTEEESLTDEQILDNILTLIIAGQVTTATTITWMVKYLDENRDIQEKLRAMQLELTVKNAGSPLTLETLNEMQFASKIVKETLRMASIVSWFPREALKDTQIGGFQIKKGWIVNVNARATHYNPTIFNIPNKFNPSRFDEESKPYSFLAFGAGVRTCLGMNLAKYMMIIFLHRLVTTYRWKVTDPDTSLEKWAMFPRLKNGCPISLEKINPK